MIEILTDGHYKIIESLFDNAKNRIRIVSPFLAPRMADLWCDRAEGLDSAFITRFYMQDFLDGSNNIAALRKMVESGITVYALIKLHTKMYLFDENEAIVGSANFTNGGLISNIEMSLHLRDEDVIYDLHDYYEELESKIRACNDGIVTLDLLDEAEARYVKLKDKVKQQGENYNVYIRGAAIDKDIEKIKDDTNAIKKELKDHTGERKTDIVFASMGGNTHDVNYTVANNIILKFFGTSKNRNDGTQPMYMEYVEDEGKKIYLSNFAVSRKRKAESVVDNDVMFVCVHSYNAEGKPSPMIVGKGHLRRFRPSNDARK